MSAGLSARHWNKGRLQDLVFFQRGFDITQAQQTPGPYPVISSSGVTSYHNEFKASGPGVIIGRKGTLGSVHFSEGDYWPHDTTLWSKDLRGNNPRFVYYYLYTVNLKRFDVGNSNPTLNRNHIHDLPVLIPPPGVQEKIADILSTYDDLIGNNQRRMALLEEVAWQLYSEWFVRLRFPGHEHTRITDGVPEGWRNHKVSALIRRIPAGKLFSQETASSEGSVPILDQGKSGLIGFHNEEASVVASIDEPVIVFANHTCFQRMIFYPFSAIQNVLPFIPSEEMPRDIFWLHYATQGIIKTNAYKGHWPEFMAKEVLVPTSKLAKLFAGHARPNLAMAHYLELQNQKLRAARNLLLLRLMSGEIAV